jgi:hypothetical protein
MRRHAALLLCSQLAAASALAQGVPHYNIDEICEAAKANPIGSAENAYDECMRDETTSRNAIEKQWDGFSVNSRAICVPVEASPSISSYTSVLTCLQEENSKGQ